MNKIKTVIVNIERGSNGNYSAYIASSNCEFGCIGEGCSVKEAESDFMEGVSEMRRVYEVKGLEFPKVEFVFKYDIASFLNYYAGTLSLAGLSRITGINQRQLSHYANGLRRPSKETANKIEKSIKLFANEMSQIRFL